MNIQEAIEKIKEMKIRGMFSYEVKKEALNIVSQIDEPQKVVVPAYIDSYIRYAKVKGMSLFIAMDNAQNKELEWIITNEETFARAWYDGYEIEEEKLYEVIIPHTSNYKNQRQYLVKQGKNWFFCGNDVNRFKYQFTKGQIEAAGFGWVFDCNGMKVEEVE